MHHLAKVLVKDERGVSALEYAILAGIIVTALVAAGVVLQSGTSGLPSLFSTLMTKITAQM